MKIIATIEIAGHRLFTIHADGIEVGRVWLDKHDRWAGCRQVESHATTRSRGPGRAALARVIKHVVRAAFPAYRVSVRLPEVL